MNNMELFKLFLSRAIGKPLETTQPTYVSGWKVVEALWPLNEEFRKDFLQLRSLPYDSSFEPEADLAIEARAFDDKPWLELPAGAKRVLLERQQQGILVALLNERDGNPLMPVPSGFPERALTGAAMLFLLHGMKLPFEVEDRSDMTLPPHGALASLRRH